LKYFIYNEIDEELNPNYALAFVMKVTNTIKTSD